MMRLVFKPIWLTLCFLVAVNSGTAEAATTINGYTPQIVKPGDAVTINGKDMGKQGQKTLGYGQGGAGKGTIAAGNIENWSSKSIRVRVPANTPPGTYWLAIYEKDGRVKAQGPEQLKVTGLQAGPGHKTARLHPDYRLDRSGRTGVGSTERQLGQYARIAKATDDFAIVGVIDPGPVQPLTKVWVKVRVHNQGGGGGPLQPVIVVWQLGGIPRMSQPVSVPRGQTVNVPVQLSIYPSGVKGTEFKVPVWLGTQKDWTKLEDRIVDNNKYDVRLSTKPPASFDVTVKVPWILVYDDCDNVSPGDWTAGLTLTGKDSNGKAFHKYDLWPAGKSSENVNGGQKVFPQMQTGFASVGPNENLRIQLGAVDCDSDTWLPTVYFNKLGIVGMNCGGEDFPEVSGDHDIVGWVELDLPPADWQKLGGAAFEKNASTKDCGPNPYKARIEVKAKAVY